MESSRALGETGETSEVLRPAEARSVWALWLLLVLAVVYLPVFTGAIVFFRDPAHWNAPARFFLAEAWTTGQDVAWNPHEGLGFPIMGSPLHGVFYPPNWLFALAGLRPEPRAAVAHLLTWMSLLHLAFGSIGVGLLARRLGCGPAARLSAALAFGLSGYTTACWSAGLLLLAGAWVPWCGLAFDGLMRYAGRSTRDVLRHTTLAALVVGLAITMGEIFVALMSLAFGLLTAAAVHLARRPQGSATEKGLAGWRGRLSTAARRARSSLGRPSTRRIAVALTSAALLGVSLGAVTLLPARALVGSTQRGSPLPRALAESCSLHPLRLVEMLVPGAMGDALEDYPGASVVGEPAVDGLPLAFSVYLGASVLGLMVLAVGRERLARRLALLALLVLGVALGKHTPLHQLLRTLVPPLAYMRYPEKYLALFVPWTSLLAGLGAQRLVDEPARARRLAAFLPVLALLAILALAGVFPDGLRPHVLRGVVAAFLALAALAATAAASKRWPRASAVALVATVSLDLAAAAWPLQVFQPVDVASEVPSAARAVLEDARAHARDVSAPSSASSPQPRVYRADAVEATIRTFVPVANIGAGEFRSVQTLVPNTVTMFGLDTVPGYDAAIPTSLRLLWERGDHSLRLLQLLAVPYAVLAISHPESKVEPRPNLTALRDPLPGARLYRVPDVLPRIYLAGEVQVLGEREVLAHVLDDAVVAGDRALLSQTAVDEVTMPALTHLSQPGRAGTCSFLGFDNARVEATCQASRDAWAVFVEQHDQGWEATLDGQPTPLVRTNVLVRGVFVPAGEHRIVLTYRAPGLRAGKLVSASALALLLLGALAAALARSGPVER